MRRMPKYWVDKLSLFYFIQTIRLVRRHFCFRKHKIGKKNLVFNYFFGLFRFINDGDVSRGVWWIPYAQHNTHIIGPSRAMASLVQFPHHVIITALQIGIH